MNKLDDLQSGASAGAGRAGSVQAGFVAVVHQASPGRIRVKVSGLRRSEPFKEQIESHLVGLDYVRSASANALTGNVLILFRSGSDVARLIGELEILARRANQGRVPEPVRSGSAAKACADRPAAPRPTRAKNAAPVTPTDVPKSDWHLQTQEEVARKLESSVDGLPPGTALARLAEYGPNALSVSKPRSKIAMVVEQLMSPPVALLGVSAASPSRPAASPTPSSSPGSW